MTSLKSSLSILSVIVCIHKLRCFKLIIYYSSLFPDKQKVVFVYNT